MVVGCEHEVTSPHFHPSNSKLQQELSNLESVHKAMHSAMQSQVDKLRGENGTLAAALQESEAKNMKLQVKSVVSGTFEAHTRSYNPLPRPRTASMSCTTFTPRKQRLNATTWPNSASLCACMPSVRSWQGC